MGRLDGFTIWSVYENVVPLQSRRLGFSYVHILFNVLDVAGLFGVLCVSVYLQNVCYSV